MSNKLNTVKIIERVSTYLVLIVIGLILIIPFLYMVSISLASPESTSKMLFSVIPKEFCYQNYIDVFKDKRIMKWLLNSVIIVAGSVIGQVLVSSYVAYGFARLKAKRKNLIFMILLATMMIPSQITMIPQFLIFTKLKWINTFLPIIIPNFFGGAYNIFLVRQFIMRIPLSLDEAAKIDGLNHFGIYRKIVLPLISPVLVAVGIFTFNYNWGAFMEPLIYINDVGKMPLALGVEILKATQNVGALPKWNIVMVASMLLTIPMLLLFLFGQKYVFELNIAAGSDSSK